MSLFKPTTCEEGVWQHCNYGFDHTKYNSFNQCMRLKEHTDCGTSISPIQRIMNPDWSDPLLIGIIIFVISIVFFFSKKLLKKKNKSPV